MLPRFLLFWTIIVLLVRSSDAKAGRSYWMEDLDDAYYDMGLGKGLDVTKNEWEIESIVQKKIKKNKKNLKVNGSCTIRFLSGKSSVSGGNIALFSTGEIGQWKVVAPNTQQKSITSCSYDEAVKSVSSVIEIDVLSDEPGDRSVITYNFPMGTGSIQPLAVVAKGKGSIKYYPNGKSSSSLLGMSGEEYSYENAKSTGLDDAVEIGAASMRIKGGKPLVDPAWAKGRRWFWTPREQPGMKTNPGYI